MIAGPVNPVTHDRLDIADPEAPEECRVHLVNVIFVAGVDRRDNPRFRVEAVGNPVLIVAQLSVQDNLEEGLHHRRHGAIELVEHDDAGSLASRLEPGWDHKGGDLLLIDCLHVGQAADLGFIHGAAADIDEGQVELICNAACDVALADAGGTAHENGDVGGELSGDEFQSRDVHFCSLRRGVWLLSGGFLSSPPSRTLYSN